MDEHLQRLIQELRAEKCPPPVLQSVARRRARRPVSLRRLRTASAVAVVCLAALLAAVMVWRRPNHDADTPSQAFAANRAQQVRVAEQAVATLGYIGNVLLEARKHTENILLNEAIPPLRSGVKAPGKTRQNKIQNMKPFIPSIALALLASCPIGAWAQNALETDPGYLDIDKAIDLKTVRPEVNINLPRFLLKDAASFFNGGPGDPFAEAGINFGELTKDIKLIRVVAFEASKKTRISWRRE